MGSMIEEKTEIRGQKSEISGQRSAVRNHIKKPEMERSAAGLTSQGNESRNTEV
ncbi:MAG: hypothetical protein ABR501_06990 [Pyrinomonadaceae bacterium]